MKNKKVLDECIQQLKKSSLLCLGPQISIRQVFERDSKGSMEGGRLTHSKDLSDMIENSGGNEYLMLISDICQDFNKRYEMVS